MGRVVTFAELAAAISPITSGDTTRFAAEHLRLAAEEAISDVVPAGSDAYLFVLGGAAMLEAAGGSLPVPPQAFAALPEGTAYSFRNVGTETLTAIRVLATSPSLDGYRGPVTVTNRAEVTPLLLAEEKKQRIYFVAPKANVVSPRAHAMIVIYEQETITPLHHHPDAESMFVLLEGAISFVINGEPAEVRPGQAAYFTINDRHSLRVADGHREAAFLEFHLPAAFTTVKEYFPA
jgi:mannose-6-phosphate isomerase-like protein (cupin superfamily)